MGVLSLIDVIAKFLMQSFGKILIVFGVIIAITGVLLLLGGKLGMGNLPGDFSWKRGNTAIYFPLVSSIAISIVLTIVVNLLLRFFR